MTTAQTQLLVAPKPFAPDVVRGHLLHGQTIAQGLTAAVRHGIITLEDVPLVRVYVMGEPLAWEDALDFVPADGDVVTVVVEPQGGDTGKTIFQLFYTIGAAIVGFYMGPWAAAAVQIAGQVITNMVWKPGKGDDLAAGVGRASLQDAGNRARVRQMMPLVLGKSRVELDLAALPYTQNVGSDVWLTVPFAVHYGAVEVTEEKLGETLLADYPAGDYQIERFLTPGPRNSTLYPSRVVQENLQDQLDFTGGGVWEVHTAAAGAKRIEVDITLPNGLKFNSPNSGKVRTEQVSVRVEYAPVDTEAWVLVPGGAYTLDMKTNDAVRRTTGWEVANPALQYKVRSKAWDPQFEYPEEEGKTWTTYWTALRSIYRAPAFLDENLAIIVLRVKSSDDLNGNLPTFTAMAEPICEVFNEGTGTWGAPVATSNAAAVLRWLMTGPAPAEPMDPADEINSSFADQFLLIRDRSWTGGMVVQEDATQEDVMLALGRMGRFSTYWNGEQLCVVPDWEKPIARQLFTGRNVEGYAYQRNLPDPVHAVLVEFRNTDADDRGDELWVYADGYTAETADVFLTLRLDFSCTKERAYREGRVFLAKYELQVETHEWSAGADSVVATFGDRVRLRHSVGLIGQAEARVQFRRWQGGVVGGLVTGVRLDTAVTMEAGKAYALDARLGEDDPDAGMLLDVEVTTQEGSTRDLVFPVPLSPSEAPAKGDLLAFGEQGLVTEDLEVLDVKPNGDSARFYAQRYLAEEIEAAETGEVPDLPTTLQPRAEAPAPRFVGLPVGDPAGVQVAFEIDPARADQVAAFAPRWRRLSDEGEGDWASLPLLPPTARQIVTPPLPAAAVQPDDPDPDYVVQIDVRTVMRSRDLSQRVQTDPIPIYRAVSTPRNLTAVGQQRVGPDGSVYPVLYVTADPVGSGLVQDLVVEVRDTGTGADAWRTAGQPLPAANPRGDLLNVQGGATVDVRGRWRTGDNWVSDWAQTAEPVAIPAGLLSTDTNAVDGVGAAVLVARVVDVESLAAASASAIAELEDVYGDTASAAASAAAAAISESNAIAAEAASIIAQGAAQAAAVDAADEALAAASAAGAALSSQNAAATSATSSATSASTAAGHASTASTQAGLAAGSATAAGSSATAAAGSASTASTHATNAGNSASAASASAVSASSSYTAALALADSLLPERIDAVGNYFVKGAASQALVAGDIATLAGFGPVRVMPAGGAVHVTRGYLPATTGKTYEISGRLQHGTPGAAPASVTTRAFVYAYDSSFAFLGTTSGTILSAPVTGTLYAPTVRVADVAATGVLAWTAGAVWLRAGVNAQGDASTTVHVRSVSTRDVTAVVQSEAQASAAATSASSASTSATNAGSSASAAATSATNASTSAGAASTSATQASNSATTAAGHASTASTQATNAANSATSAGNSASAAATSASTASTHATNAGNSATAAQSSAVAAESAFEDAEAEADAAAASATASAGSASAASTSASAAGSSASAANTSATNAATSAGAASTSATNASNSATTASGHASNASTSASAAAGSATSAGNSATAASGSASTASTAATNAGNSATAAAASQVAAASSYSATLAATALNLPARIGANGEYFRRNATLPVLAADVVNLSGFGLVRSASHGNAVHLTEGRFPATAGRIYEVSVDLQLSTLGSGAPGFSTRLYGYDGTDTLLSTVTGPQTALTTVGTVVTVTRRYGVTAPTGGTAWPAGAVWLRGGGIAQSDATSNSYIRETRIRDITSQVEAEVQAAASVTSASSAASSASAAGSSATAASGSATAASTSAGAASTSATNASTSATNASTSASAASTQATNAASSASAAAGSASTASTQASNASASAAAASSAASVAASVGVRALNRNANFNDYPTTPGVPTSWVNNVNGSGTRVTGETGLYAFQLAGGAGVEGSVYQDGVAGSLTPQGWYVLEAQVRLDAGALTGAGVMLRSRTSGAAALTDYLLSFATDTGNNTRAAVGAGTVGRIYRFAKLLKVTDATADRFTLYARSHAAAHGSVAAANSLTWFQALVRPATDQEIDTQAATAGLVTLSASVTTISTAMVDLEDGYALAHYSLSAVTPGGAAVLALVSDDYGTVAGLSADQIYFGENTFFDNATDTLRTTTGANARVIALGASFGTDGQLTEWEGPAATSFASMSRANAYFYRANVAPYVGGGAINIGTGFSATLSYTARSGSRVGAGVATTGLTTVSTVNAAGDVTYAWTRVSGDAGITATSPAGAATAFTATLAVGQTLSATFQCAVSDGTTTKYVTCTAFLSENT